MTIRKGRQITGCAIIALIWAGTAHAQEAAPAQSEQASNEPAAGEIVVTANKRVQNLNDVGMTAAVLGADSLKQQNVTSLEDIAALTPSLTFARAPNGTPVYTLRGVGFYETSIGAYPSVSIYVDEIPLPFPVMSAHSTYDLERVEVLKGPQGTLFGQNATGGAINYIAAKPTNTLQAGGSLTYGRFNQTDVEAYLSGPLAEGLKARISGRAEFGDGWQISASRPNERNGKVENFMGRLQLAYEPSSSLRFLLNVNGWLDKGEQQAPQYIAQQFQNENVGVPFGFGVGAFRDPAILASPFTALNSRAADWSTSSHLLGIGKVPFTDNSMFQASLRTDLDVGDFGTLTSLTGYSKFKQRQGNDTDGLPLNALDVPLTLGKIESFYQEVRLANDPKNRFRFVIGGNYSTDKVRQSLTIDYTNSSATLGFGTLFGFPLSMDTLTNSQRFKSYAAFGNLEFDLLDNLKLKAGARYTKSKDDANICQSDPEGPNYPFGNVIKFFGTLYSGAAFVPYAPGECASINVDSENPANRVVTYLPYGATGVYINTLDEDNVSWMLGLDYKVSPDVLLYANVSKGYKAGSFPSITGSTLNQYQAARQESVMAYEGGLKATALGGGLQFNLAGFYYDYADKQLRTKLTDPTFGQLDVLRNIPKSSVRGFEVEATLRPTRDLTINGAYTYLDAKIDRFVGTNAGGDTGVNFAGTPIPYTPKHQASFSVNYNPAISDHVNLIMGSSLTYNSKTIATLGGNVNPSTINAKAVPCVYCIDGYAVLDAQLGIEDSNGRWRAFIWGKNITDKYYWSNVVSGYDTVARYAGKPATYGVTVSYSFK